MATAVQTSSEPKTPNTRVRLALASLFGAAFVIAGIAVAVYLVPMAWKQVVGDALASLGKVDFALRLVIQVAIAVGFIWLGVKLAGSNPPRGLRGGIFIAALALFAVFFLTVTIGTALESQGSIGSLITLVCLGALLAGTYYGLISPRAERWMVGIEQQGWFSTFHYKKAQGIRMRRYTMIGLLLVGGTGVWTLFTHETMGRGDWKVRIPFTETVITILSDIHYTVPVLIAGLTIWFSWRAVNMPTFADFLIATEAEMNKVSWSSRKRLIQDTIVVLTTLFLLTVFLFAVDWFWGTVLSWKPIGVLPAQKDNAAQVNTVEGKKVDW